MSIYFFSPRYTEPLYKSEVVSFVFGGTAVIGSIITFLSILNLGTSLSVFPKPKTGNNLKSTGLYSISRHPIYTGLILVFFSLGFADADLPRLITSLALTALFFFKARYEENLLLEIHPNYSSYQKKVGMFFPKSF